MFDIKMVKNLQPKMKDIKNKELASYLLCQKKINLNPNKSPEYKFLTHSFQVKTKSNNRFFFLLLSLFC